MSKALTKLLAAALCAASLCTLPSGFSGVAQAQPAEKQDKKKVEAKAAEQKADDARKPDAADSKYCGNITDAAADARFVLQKEAMAKVETDIEGRIKVLEAKRAEYETWLNRREELLKKADEKVLEIYARMRPDAAAIQLANVNEQLAAAILIKLSPRISSSVMNEMEPGRAAQLTNLMTDAPNRAPVTAGGKNK